MAPRMKTRERIVQNSLELFNQQGERSVSTNHIAAHMEISPGNLYYHFPNKQAIIAVLFNQYEELVDSFLRPPQGRVATVEDKRFYLKALLAAMWNYRFLHRDLEHLLDSDPELAARYRRFSQRCLQQGQAIYRGFVDAGILAMDAAQVESLTINAWIVLTSWVRFLSTTREHSAHLGEEAFKRGVYRCWCSNWASSLPARVPPWMPFARSSTFRSTRPGAVTPGFRAIDQEIVMPLAQLITPTQLAERLGAPGLVILDCRFALEDVDYGQRSYALGHIAGAHFADLERDLSGPVVKGVTGRHPLPDPQRLVERLREWGMDNDSQVVLYDDGPGAFAARAWWLLAWLGKREGCRFSTEA